MPPKPVRRSDPVTNMDIAHSNSHLNSLFGGSNKAWMEANAGSVASNRGANNFQPVVIASDIRADSKRKRKRPRKHPETAPGQPAVPSHSSNPPSDATLLSPALTNEPSPAYSNRHTTPQIDVLPTEAATHTSSIFSPGSREQRYGPNDASVGILVPPEEYREATSTLEPQIDNLTPWQPDDIESSVSVVASSTQQHGRKRQRESSGVAEDAAAIQERKRPRGLDITEFVVADHPKYQIMMENLGEKLQKHLVEVGGYQSMPKIDKQRYRYLQDACERRDGFYLVTHQLLCAWTDHSDTVHHLLGSVSADKVDRAFEILQQILRPNDQLEARHRKHFANWPRKLSDLDPQMSGSSLYRRHLPLVTNFVDRLPDKWKSLLDIVEKRGFPILAKELIHTLGCWSTVMRTSFFFVSRRMLGIRDSYAAQIQALWDLDQDYEIKAAQGLVPAGVMERHRLSLRMKYQSATADARRKASLRDVGSASGSPTPSSISVVSTPRLEPATMSSAQSTGTTEPGNLGQDVNIMIAGNHEETMQTAAPPMEQQPAATGQHQQTQIENSQPAAMIGQMPEPTPAGIQQLAQRLEVQTSQAIAADSTLGPGSLPPIVSAGPRQSQVSTPTSGVQAAHMSATASDLPSRRLDPTTNPPSNPYVGPDFIISLQQMHSQAFQLADTVTAAHVNQNQSKAQQHGTMNGTSPNMAAAEMAYHQRCHPQPGHISQASPNMTYSHTPQHVGQTQQRVRASPLMSTAQAPLQQGQVPRLQVASPNPTTQPPYFSQQNYQMEQSPNQGGLTMSARPVHNSWPLFMSDLLVQGNQTPMSGSPVMQAPQQGSHRQYPGPQGPHQQFIYYQRQPQPLQGSPTNNTFSQAGSPAAYQAPAAAAGQIPQSMGYVQSASMPGWGAAQQCPQNQSRGRPAPMNPLASGLSLRPLEENDSPGSPHDWISAHMAAHLPRSRSPLRKPLNDAVVGRHYQFLKGFAVDPHQIRPGFGIRTVPFELALDPAIFLRRMVNEIGTHIQPYCNNALRLRLRCCQQPEQALLSETTWVSYATKWPPEVYLSFNDHPLDVPRKLQFKYDLPIELTDLLLAGRNELKIVIPGTSTPRTGAYFFAVEIVRIVSHDQLLKTVVPSNKFINAEQFKGVLAKRLSSGQDDDIQVNSDAGITISIADPWTSVMFKLPVRGVLCQHLECFDFETLLETRPTKPTTSKTSREPTLVDAWKCPICNRDVRPCSLGVDLFLLDVRNQLLAQGKGNVKAIVAQADGSWSAVDEPDDDDEDAKSPVIQRQPSSPLLQRPAPEVIEIDDD